MRAAFLPAVNKCCVAADSLKLNCFHQIKPTRIQETQYWADKSPLVPSLYFKGTELWAIWSEPNPTFINRLWGVALSTDRSGPVIATSRPSYGRSPLLLAGDDSQKTEVKNLQSRDRQLQPYQLRSCATSVWPLAISEWSVGCLVDNR